jgi:hypothetical protein
VGREAVSTGHTLTWEWILWRKIPVN